MARTGIKNTKMFLMKPSSVVGLRCMSSLARPNHRTITNTDSEGPAAVAADEHRQREEAAGCWIPHPRTGIYFPKGQEWVMDDIPNDAASFDCTFWLRNIDGVEDHKPDNDIFMHNSPK